LFPFFFFGRYIWIYAKPEGAKGEQHIVSLWEQEAELTGDTLGIAALNSNGRLAILTERALFVLDLPM
jgi:hypothetical protein